MFAATKRLATSEMPQPCAVESHARCYKKLGHGVSSLLRKICWLLKHAWNALGDLPPWLQALRTSRSNFRLLLKASQLV